MTSTTNGGIEQRVFMHYKSLKHEIVWVKDRDCDESHDYERPVDRGRPHMHGHYECSTPNAVWLRLARVHKMPVRQVKDIVSKKRGWKPDESRRTS